MRYLAGFLLVALAVAACQDMRDPVAPSFAATCTDRDFAAGLCGGTLPPPPPPSHPPIVQQGGPYPDGETAFIAECAPCHASRDGFDLAYFSYFDSTIVRRALAHVDSSTAQQITAYINTLNTPQVPEMTLLWQPGGSKLATDAAFAVELFGADAWPSTLTRAQLLARDPLQVRIAIALKPWSTEATGNGATVEWMPDTSLSAEVLGYNGGAASSALASYYSNPTVPNLDAVITTVEAAAQGIGICDQGSGLKYFTKCFEARRWTSSLSATHKLRSGNPNGFLSTTVYLGWWFAGEIARLSRGYPPSVGGGQIADWLRHFEAWEYVAWSFDPGHVPAVYTAMPFTNYRNLRRHAVWIANRSMVARPSWCILLSPTVCDEDARVDMDLRVLAGAAIAGTGWANDPANFGLDELLRRVSIGDRPPTQAERNLAILLINQAMSMLVNKVTAGQHAALRVKADAVIAGLQ